MNSRTTQSVLLVCIAVLFAAGSALAAPPPTAGSPDLLDKMLAEGWQAVAPGVLERKLEGHRTETFAMGAEGFAWVVKQTQSQLGMVLDQYRARPTPRLRRTIRSLEAEIAKLQSYSSALKGDFSNPPPEECGITYDAHADAYPKQPTPGVRADADASFNNNCGFIGDTYAYAFARATLNGVETTVTQTHPNSGANVSSNATASAAGDTNCYSYGLGRVTSFDLGISYQTADENFMCPPDHTFIINGTAHSFHLDANRHVIDLSLSSAGIWQKQDLTALTGAGLAEPDSALTAFVDSLGNGRVFYTGTNHHVLQLKLDTANTWTQGDVMIQAGTTNTAAPGSALTSFGAAGGAGGAAVHVLYLDASQHVNLLSRTSAGFPATWSNLDLTALTGAGLAVPGSALTGFVDGIGNGRVFYVGTNLHVLQLKLDTTNTWTQGDVMTQAGTSKTAASDSALFSFGAAGSSAVHVLYLDSSQHVNDLARTSAGFPATWSNQDLTALTGAGLAIPGSALTGLIDSIGNGRVFYVGTNQHVLQLKLDPTNTWTYGDVMVQAGTSKTVAPGSGLTSFGNSGGSAVHVLYLDSIQHVNDLARTSAGFPSTWSNQDVTALTEP